ncbi:MAG TPA: tetratricopeptide repeat protein [Burkholderiales bacterium]|nr:tetratricopeptide repeat protein [Burkholderiales bacterium]
MDYGLREAAKLLRLAPGTIRRLIRAGFVSPSRGPRNAWRFSFRDLIVLRTAQSLVAANVSPRRVMRSIRELRRRLPSAMPLSGLNISAEGDHLVVGEGTARWHAESGQYLLRFHGNPADGSLRVMETRRREQLSSAADWFDRGAALEAADAEAALAAYEHALALEPGMPEAGINLGRLLHQLGRLTDAEQAYRGALRISGDDARLLYNLGLVLEDLGRREEAFNAYEAALRLNPRFADCCYNLALLSEALRKPREAIRYMAQYRRLLQSGK